MKKNRTDKFKIQPEHFYMIIFALFGALGHPLGKIIVRTVHPFQFGTVTLITGFFTILIYLAITGHINLFFTLTLKDILLSLCLGVFGFFFFQILTFSALSRIPASMNAVIISTTVIFTILFASIILKEKISLLTITGILLAFSGVVFITFNRGFHNNYTVDLIGCSFSLLAAIFNALYLVLGKNILSRNDPLIVTSIAVFSGSILLTLLTFCTVGFYNFSFLEINTWILMIVTGITLIGISYPILFICLKRMPASWISIYIYLVPVFAIILSLLILKESFSWIFWLGVVLILSGIFISD